MNRQVSLLAVTALLFSCSQLPHNVYDSDSLYTIEFTSPDVLQETEKGRCGFGFCSDGSSLYLVNGYTIARYAFSYGTDDTNINDGQIQSWPELFSDVLKYDINKDEWIELTDMLVPKVYCVSEYLNKKIFVFNGVSYPGNINDKCEVIDTETGKIEFTFENPCPLNFGGISSWRGKFYLFGRENEKNKLDISPTQLWVFNPVSGSWKRLSQIPDINVVKGEIIDGTLYLFCKNSKKGLFEIFTYNVLTSSMVQIGSINDGFSPISIAQHGKSIWLLLKKENNHFLALFDSVSNKMIFVYTNTTINKESGIEIVNNSLFLVGGMYSRKRVSGSVQEADISLVEKQLSEARESLINE